MYNYKYIRFIYHINEDYNCLYEFMMGNSHLASFSNMNNILNYL